MDIKKILSIALIGGLTQHAFAQYTEDAFNFSRTENSTTARFSALGGQQTSMGGDLSSIYGNPAGLGMFSRSEFGLSIGLNSYKNNHTFLGNTGTDNIFNPTINNIGIVLHSPVAKYSGDTKKGLVAVSYGIGYQKNNYFKNELNLAGTTNKNGLSNFFAEKASGDNSTIPEELTSETVFGAYYGYLIDGSGNSYVPNTHPKGDQSVNVLRKGGQSNIDLSFGLNFSNQVYIGAGLGIASVNYKSRETLWDGGDFLYDLENPITPAPPAGQPQYPEFNSKKSYNANFYRNYDTEGSGVNFKLGAIIKPVDEFRIGFSFESPTYYDLTDNYYESLSYVSPYNEKIYREENFPMTYNLRTPLKLNGGISYIIGNKGFLSADINYSDYSTAKFSSNSKGTDRNVNDGIQQNYKDVVNYGVGGEFKVSNEFAVRAGYRYLADPYNKKNNSVNNAINRYSGGFGYKVGSYSIDAAVMVYDSKDGYNNYTLSTGDQPYADISKTTTRFSITFGARF